VSVAFAVDVDVAVVACLLLLLQAAAACLPQQPNLVTTLVAAKSKLVVGWE
jgi:hypothetical protein